MIQNTASAKEIAEKAAANSLSGNTILFADLARIKKHKVRIWMINILV